MIRRAFLPVLAAFLIAFGSTSAWAGPMGTFAVIDGGVPSANTNSILTASSFTIGDLTHLGANAATGLFAGMPAQDFSSITFNNAGGLNTSFSMGPLAYFGSFASTSVFETTSTSGSQATASFFILGSWTSGTAFSPSGPYDASLTLSFTQTSILPGGVGGAISDSGTFSVPPAANTLVPEPSSIVLMGLGCIGLVGCRWLRRKCA